MAVNKVVYGGVPLIDLSDSTVTPETLAKGATAYDKSGEKITGTMESGSDSGGGDSGDSGGGLPSGFTALATGTLTPTADISENFEITHGLGVIPDFAILLLDQDISNGITYWSYLLYHAVNKISYKENPVLPAKVANLVWSYTSSNGAFTGAANAVPTLSSVLTEQTFIVNNISDKKLKSGIRYRWIVGVLDKGV